MPELELIPRKKVQENKLRIVPVSSNTVNTDSLIASCKVLTIIHHNSQYQLRITSKNKLILTK